MPEQMDLNQATFAEIASLPGIGPTNASRIVRFRDQVGHISAVEDLSRIPGIGASTLETLQIHTIIADPATISQRDEAYFEDLVYQKFNRRRFTQDSPILLDVYVHYGTDPDKRQDLLITPDWSKRPDQLAHRLQQSFRIAGRDEQNDDSEVDARTEEALAVAFNQSVVAIKLTFTELLQHLLPLSWWWNDWLIPMAGRNCQQIFSDPRTQPLATEQLATGLAYHLGQAGGTGNESKGHSQRTPSNWMIRDDLVWAAHLFFVVEHSNRPNAPDDQANNPDTIATWFSTVAAEAQPTAPAPDGKPWVFSVNRNRTIHQSTRYSVPTTKADVAQRTFSITGSGITWAVIDSGIDATHIAFRKQDPATGLPYHSAFDNGENRTRVKATYDFSRIRDHLSQNQRRALTSQTGRLIDWATVAENLQRAGDTFAVPHNTDHYVPPDTPHGTHVAGILGADWDPSLDDRDPIGPPGPTTRPNSPIRGMCPGVELYDLRVFQGYFGDEFAVMSAMQFVRSINQRQDALEIHGVNLSLSVYHDVANFACGRSPVCEEATRLVDNGVVVVAAAGNDGRTIYTSPQGVRESGYRTVSIADPGNAEAVITVGATHRISPHTYGVSYFSSRGPTGDGRMKPDLVAPGEKVYSSVPGDRVERNDGTSQAAPHVSGAAALLMDRHRELIGQPERVKEILMATATDLGRERSYQGAGLVDVLRAIQSI